MLFKFISKEKQNKKCEHADPNNCKNNNVTNVLK